MNSVQLETQAEMCFLIKSASDELSVLSEIQREIEAKEKILKINSKARVDDLKKLQRLDILLTLQESELEELLEKHIKDLQLTAETRETFHSRDLVAREAEQTNKAFQIDKKWKHLREYEASLMLQFNMQDALSQKEALTSTLQLHRRSDVPPVIHRPSKRFNAHENDASQQKKPPTL
jgi:hypothetical protein